MKLIALGRQPIRTRYVRWVSAAGGSDTGRVDIKTERLLRYIELGGSGVGYGVATTPHKRYLYPSLRRTGAERRRRGGVDAKALTIINTILDPDLNGPRHVRFPSY
jgi:hypothetical protein